MLIRLSLVSDGVICVGFGRDCSIQIPHKIKHFSWWATRDILPTKENLVYMKVLVDSMCEEYGNAPESFFHLFWECSKAWNTWGSSSLFTSLSLIPFRIFYDFLWYILRDAQWGMEDTRLAVTIAWALWTNRNDMIHGKLRKTSLLLVDWCRSYLGEY